MVTKTEKSFQELQERLVLLDSLDKKLLGASLDKIYSRDKSVRSIFVLGGHEWGNIGDLAISYSQQVFLEKMLPDLKVYSVTRQAVTHNWQRLSTSITSRDIIVLPGGGNMGDLWVHEEIARRKIVETFKENRIISFPQSIHFDSDAEVAKSASVYNAHGKLMIAVRDTQSFEFASKIFDKCEIVRTEDIVTSYEFPFSFLPEHDDVLFIKRADKEKLAKSGLEALEKDIKKEYGVRYTDTLVPNLEFSNMELAAKLVYKKIDEIHSSKLVVTDRLHGVIFTLLAQRPVIVFDNSYGKISGALENILPAYKDFIILVNENTPTVDLERVNELMNLKVPYPVLGDVLKSAHTKFASEIRKFIKKDNNFSSLY